MELAVRHNLRLANPELAKEVEEARKRMTQQKEGEKMREEADKSIGTGDPGSAYWAHYRDIVSRESGAPDYSRIDGMTGVRMRATGYSQEQIRSAIETNASAMRRENMTPEAFESKYRNRDWNKYAAETTEKYVFGARGAVQYSKALDYRLYYMRLEGRDIAEEQRAEREQAQRERKADRGR